MKVLVTGACGFIGRHVCRRAKGEAFDVYGVDLADEAGPGLEATHYVGIAAELGALERVVGRVRPDVCIHAAGRASVADSMNDPAPDFAAGPELTFSLLNLLRRQVPECRLVFLSSAAVYGNPATLPVNEKQTPAPISPYGFHKLQCELLCHEFAQVFGLRTSVVRIFSAYGEGLRRQVLWDIVRQIAVEGRLVLHGAGDETRDFVHVSDVAAGLLLVAQRSPMKGEIYNLASGRETSVRELALMAVSALGSDVVPRFDGEAPRGDPLRWRADVTRIEALGFRPKATLEAGVGDYAKWCRRQFNEPAL